jgi:hypothetical protein
MPITETQDQISPELAAQIRTLLARIFQEDFCRFEAHFTKLGGLASVEHFSP